MNQHPILLIEDSSDDAFFLQRAFTAAGVSNDVVVLSDGEAAVEYLTGLDASGAGSPCLVLMDVKLPYRSGIEVLQWIRASRRLATLPVIMMTSSNEPSDVQRALESGANAYVVKPSAYTELTQLVTSIRDFWLRYHRSGL